MNLDLGKLKEIAGRAFIVSFHDEGGVYIGDGAASQITALIGELEKAKGDREFLDRVATKFLAQRDSARALLREAAEGLPRGQYWKDLRARIKAEIGE